MVVPNDPGKATAVVNWSVTQVSDNSVDVDPHAVIKVQSSHQPLDVFPIGSHVVTVTATDEAGNTADCRFDIEVIGKPDQICQCYGCLVSFAAVVWARHATLPPLSCRARPNDGCRGD